MLTSQIWRSVIYDVLSSAPLNTQETLLRNFSIECADLRNDVSHFGAQKTGITYNSFIVDLAKKSEALSIIYHIVILHEIGIDDNTINEWIYRRGHSRPKLGSSKLATRVS